MTATEAAPKPQVFILDVDGVMTDGAQYYTAEGKLMKRFGPDDHDALSLIKKRIEIRFVSGDARGFEISRRRIETDMKFPLDLVSTHDRVAWIAERYPLDRVIYMGDGLFDALVFRRIAYGIAPADADPAALHHANHVTRRPGGHRAVAEACMHVMTKFFEGFDVLGVDVAGYEVSGGWTA